MLKNAFIAVALILAFSPLLYVLWMAFRGWSLIKTVLNGWAAFIATCLFNDLIAIVSGYADGPGGFIPSLFIGWIVGFPIFGLAFVLQAVIATFFPRLWKRIEIMSHVDESEIDRF